MCDRPASVGAAACTGVAVNVGTNARAPLGVGVASDVSLLPKSQLQPLKVKAAKSTHVVIKTVEFEGFKRMIYSYQRFLQSSGKW